MDDIFKEIRERGAIWHEDGRAIFVLVDRSARNATEDLIAIRNRCQHLLQEYASNCLTSTIAVYFIILWLVLHIGR